MKNLLNLGKALTKKEQKKISGGCPQGFFCGCEKVGHLCKQFVSSGTDCNSYIQGAVRCQGQRCIWL